MSQNSYEEKEECISLETLSEAYLHLVYSFENKIHLHTDEKLNQIEEGITNLERSLNFYEKKFNVE